MKKEQLFQLPILRSSYQDMTKSERRIADYIMENERNIMEQTISDIAVQTKSSEITVSRFCKKLGFSGLQSLKIALAGEVYTPNESIYQDIHQTDSYEMMAGKIFRNINDGLQDTLKLLDFTAVEKAVEILCKARSIAVYGLGNSATVCHDIETRFLRFGMMVHAYADSHMQVTSASLLTAEDVVIAVSHTGSTIELLQSVDIAKENNASVIAITSYVRSPLAKRADIILHGMGREVRYRSEAVASRLVHFAIADLLYTGISLQDTEKYMSHMNKMRQAIAKRRV
jgi:DNA-binding MurR/RpiR family transcriptional regulator